MIAEEIKTDVTTVRIHDEFCSSPSQGCISHMNQIVTNSFKRRNTEGQSSDPKNTNSMPQ